MLKKKIFTTIGFKLVWLSCVFGELYISSLLGFLAGIIFLLIFAIYEKKKLSFVKIVLTFSFLGYTFDSLLIFFELYSINAKINFLFLPIWFLVLWPSFCCLLIDVLSFLKNKKIFAIILGGFFGPLSYYAGVSSGLANFSSVITFFLISLYWALMMFLYSKYFIKIHV